MKVCVFRFSILEDLIFLRHGSCLANVEAEAAICMVFLRLNPLQKAKRNIITMRPKTYVVIDMSVTSKR